MSEWGERRHKSPNDASVILCDLVAERENSSQQENMQKRAADTSGSLCVACSTDLQERVVFLWGPLKFSIFGESGGTSRPMSPATFFATLLPNARVPLLLAKRNARFCFNFKGPLTRWGEILVFRSFHSRDLACFDCHYLYSIIYAAATTSTPHSL